MSRPLPNRHPAPSTARSLARHGGPAPGRPLVSRLLLAGALALSSFLAAAGPAAAQDPFAAFQRLRGVLEDPSGPAGALPVECTVRMEEQAGRRVELPVEVLVDLTGLPTLPERLRVTLGAATIEGELATFQETVATGFLPAAEGDGRPEAWLYRGRLELADDVHGAAAVVEVLGAAAWGGCFAELADQPLAPPPGMRVAIHDPAAEEPGSADGADRNPADAASASAGASPAGAAARSIDDQEDDDDEKAAPQVIVLLPPKGRPARGRTDFDTMVTTELVQSAVFYLDGEEAARDDRRPFSATLDMGEEVVPHTVRVVGLDRGGVPLGEHEVTVNRRSAPFDVAITRLRPVHSHRPAPLPGEGSFIHVELSVSVPPGKALDRVEVYRNEELITTLHQPPWTARIPQAGGTGPADYVRALAVLTDGESLEDVRLISGGAAQERVEVNLVELFTVVTSPDGAPIEGLGPEDFRISWRGERRPVERFQVADDVPLTLGLLVDTSGSMDALMVDAKQAAGRFLLETLIEGDEAFLVDFDNRPRLLQGATGNVSLLLRSFTKLTPGGFTALYDAIVYSLAQIQETGGRRAVVLVTDGVDEGSRFTSRRVIHDAKRLAVPVYVISLAGLYNERGTVRRADLEAITGHTGGRIYYISQPEELAAAYDEINRELRSQYVLAFGTERFLTEDELDDVELETTRNDLEVRWTVGSSR